MSERKDEDLRIAKTFMGSGRYTCVFCQGEDVYTSAESGVLPILGLIDNKVDLNGFTVVDKVVGKAMALLFIYTGVARVNADVMSTSAIDLLRANKIQVGYETEVPSIQNADGTGDDAMETLVAGIDDPEKAFEAIKKAAESEKE